jgi:hypothetical protein
MAKRRDEFVVALRERFERAFAEGISHRMRILPTSLALSESHKSL